MQRALMDRISDVLGEIERRRVMVWLVPTRTRMRSFGRYVYKCGQAIHSNRRADSGAEIAASILRAR